jgi:hypothetical protein
MTSTMNPRPSLSTGSLKLVYGLLVCLGVLPWAVVAGFYVWPFYVLVAFPLLLLTIWVGTIIHEIGHLSAALLMGLYVQKVAIIPLKAVRSGGGFHLQIFVSPKKDGFVTAYPLDARQVRQRMMAFIAGGPVANLMASLMCLALAWLVDRTAVPLVPRDHLCYWLDFIGLMNLIDFIINVIPVQSGKSSSDGSKLIAFARNDSWIERQCLLEALQSSMLGGTRPSAWNAAQVERMLALRGGSPGDFGANLFGYYYALDTGQIESAGAYLDLAEAQCATLDPKLFDAAYLEKAYYEAFYRSNIGARAWLTRVRSVDNEKHTCWRAEAAVLLVEGCHAEAVAKAEAALGEAPNSTDKGGSLAEAEWLRILLAECLKRIPPRGQDLLPPATAASQLGTT